VPEGDRTGSTVARARHVDRDGLSKLGDSINYLGLSGEMVDGLLATLSPAKNQPK